MVVGLVESVAGSFSIKLKICKFKFHIFWEGHKFLRNLHRRFVYVETVKSLVEISQKFCDLLRIYELYPSLSRKNPMFHWMKAKGDY